MVSVKFFDSTLSDLTFDRRELYLLMGYGNHTPCKDITDIIDEMMAELHLYCKPRYGYILSPGKTIDKEHLQIGDTIFQPGKIITHAMREASCFALFTASIGPAFDEWSHRLRKEDDMIKPFIADAIGSVLAEATVSLLMKQLEKDMLSEGLLITNNYSPGYCDWLLSEQKALFSFFPDNISGISLTDSCLMLPVKSVSGIVGIGTTVKQHAYGCDICKMSSCVRNKKKHPFP